MKRVTKKKLIKFQQPSIDLERELASHITKAGADQIRRRRKAGLSVFFLKDGRIVEVRPDKTEIHGQEITMRWIKIDRGKRTVVLK